MDYMDGSSSDSSSLDSISSVEFVQCKRPKLSSRSLKRHFPPKIGDPYDFNVSNPEINDIFPITKKKSNGSKNSSHSRNSFQNTPYNNDYCDACGQPGDFVCCDSCPRSFHFICVEPPIDLDLIHSIENWYCNYCRPKREIKQENSVQCKSEYFMDLIAKIESMNPISFSLPESIRKNFEGVGCNQSTGDYVDLTEIKSGRVTRSSGYLDEGKFENDEGQLIVCHKCARTALSGMIINCDYCPLAWHYDCLNPPLTTPPVITKKWKCPAHVNIKRKKMIRAPELVEVNNIFFKNDGDIDILLESEFPTGQTSRRKRIVHHLPEQSIKLGFPHNGNLSYENFKNANDIECLNKACVVTAPDGLIDYYGPVTQNLNSS